MKLTDLLIKELEQECIGSRKVLEHVPEGKNDWKPHDKSMPLGALATMVANMPAWLEMIVKMNEIDINPPGGPKFKPEPWKTRQDLQRQLDSSLEKGRKILEDTTDDQLLNTRWKLLSSGKQLMDMTRYEAIRETVINHLAHHRGQLTVYLRLCGEKVPAIYGPSADEGK